MSRYLLTLNSNADRLKAVRLIEAAPRGARVEVKAVKRSLPQNDLMWSMLSDIAQVLPWHGVKLTPDEWKLLFLDALNREVRIVKNLDGNGFVNLGRRSSDLSKDEMSQLIELIKAFAANNGVALIDDDARAA